MKTLSISEARKKGLESYDFELFDGTKMIAYYENTPIERGDRMTPDYGGFVTIYYIVREKDYKVFNSDVLDRYQGFDEILLEEEIGEKNYGY